MIRRRSIALAAASVNPSKPGASDTSRMSCDSYNSTLRRKEARN
jgi:hypothetical protein